MPVIHYNMKLYLLIMKCLMWLQKNNSYMYNRTKSTMTKIPLERLQSLLVVCWNTTSIWLIDLSCLISNVPDVMYFLLLSIIFAAEQMWTSIIVKQQQAQTYMHTHTNAFLKFITFLSDLSGMIGSCVYVQSFLRSIGSVFRITLSPETLTLSHYV